jgi:quercetin dioxygenase-like cupin family protein
MIQSVALDSTRAAVHLVRPHEGVLGSLRILAGVEQTRGLYFAFESETPPAQSTAALDMHAHAAYDESEYVLTGTREIVIEGQRWQAEAGFFALAPRHARHGMRTVGSAPSRWLHFFSPAQIERYFVERERLRAQGASADELRALGQSHRVGDAPLSRTAEAAYASAVGARRDGVVITGRETRNAYAVAEWSVRPEQDHAHPDQEEAFYVISGELTLEIEGVMLTAPARSFVLIPRGFRHRHIAVAGTRLLTVFSPGHTVPHELHRKLR